MTVSPWKIAVAEAFRDDQSLSHRILESQGVSGQLIPLFHDIAKYILAGKPQSTHTTSADHFTTTFGAGLLPDNTKKRKLEHDLADSNSSAKSHGVVDWVTLYSNDAVSVSAPMRKKLKLSLYHDRQDLGHGNISLANPASGAVEYRLSTSGVDQVFCLPVPEKQARQWNFCVFPKPDSVGGSAPLEPLLFTMNEGKPGPDGAPAPDDDVVSVERGFTTMLAPHGGGRVIRPHAADFASSIPQSHRKGEVAYHVKAHRGSKEGYLFFLSPGIVFGFKKPLVYFPFSAIESISYTAVLQRTFDLVIAATGVDGAAPGETKEVEFSMIDQADFAPIDEYVKKHGLNDASMAAARRAKASKVNKDNKRVLTAGGENGEGVQLVDGEDQDALGAEDDEPPAGKTEQELQDEEDELEEDYEASGGESDGEGEYSEEEDEDGEGYEDGEEEGGE